MECKVESESPPAKTPGLTKERLLQVQNMYWVLDSVKEPKSEEWNDWILSPHVKPISDLPSEYDWRRPTFSEIALRQEIYDYDRARFERFVVGPNGGFAFCRPPVGAMPQRKLEDQA